MNSDGMLSLRANEYLRLVEDRRSHEFPSGLSNPSKIEGGQYDSQHLNPWAQWQGDLGAELLVIGQDWGDERYFLRENSTKPKGHDDDSEVTCLNLQTLAKSAGFTLGLPNSPNPQKVYLTNAVLGIRTKSGKSGHVKQGWVHDSRPFLRRLIDLIQPKAIVSLGAPAFRACSLLLGNGAPEVLDASGMSLKEVHRRSPFHIQGQPTLFAMYHCGRRALNSPNGRSLELQCQDWAELGAFLRKARRKGSND